MADPHVLAELAAHYQVMPPVRAMQLGIDGFEDGILRLSAPLAPNVNDKGCAFGGSLASLMTLAGWGRVWLGVQAHGLEADIYVADSHLRYLAPVYGELRASAMFAPESDWARFLACLRSRGRARIDIVARIDLPDGSPAATFTGNFAALTRSEAAQSG